MTTDRILTVIRTGSVILVLAAIVAEATVLAGEGAFDPTRFFAFFAIQSNLIGVLAVVWVLSKPRGQRSLRLESFRGAAAVFLTVTFFVVIFLLADVDLLQLPWVDFVLHKLFPVIVVLDWIVDPPGHRLSYRNALVWVLYPVVWTGFTLVRGVVDNWYPYPFIDPANGGYGIVALVVTAITVVFLVFAVLHIWLGNWRSGAAEPRPVS